MKSFLSASLLSLLLCVPACAPGIRSGCPESGRTTVGRSELRPMIPYSADLRKYHMTVDFGKRNFSGLLLLRQQGDTTRILFTTHFGMTLFDLEMDGNTHRLHQCIPPLNKKKLFSLLRRDFATLFGQRTAERNQAIIYTCREPQGTVVYKLTGPEAKGHYRKRLHDGTVDRITTGSAFGKTDFSLHRSAHTGADSISVSHPLLKLHFSITAFD